MCVCVCVCVNYKWLARSISCFYLALFEYVHEKIFSDKRNWLKH